MTRTLPHLLVPGSAFPLAELSALGLDGELRRVDNAYVPVDHPDSRSLRTAAVRLCVPPGSVAELQTAQWIHGARSRAPSPHTVCIPAGSTQRPSSTPAFRLREVVLPSHDVITLHGLQVTTVERTVIDVLRIVSRLTDDDFVQLASLLAAHGLTTDRCRARLRSLTGLPNKTQAARRLTRLDALAPPGSASGMAALESAAGEAGAGQRPEQRGEGQPPKQQSAGQQPD